MTMLMVAAANGEVDQARALLAAGADPNLRASDGRTALMLAVMQEHVEMVRLLLDAHADPNLGMATLVPNWELRPLLLATMKRNEALAELLRNAGGELGQSQGSPAKAMLSGEEIRP
jgi:ankyrin repeat protein